ncbi:hypothetical protein ACFWI5_27245 [Streptomyces sp. NPDC127064]|uniref:hypothetical protein n=1 Tax=Streptomyces sp. NPDC127064 TaxID=3347124 RepID=UPI00364AD186
MSGTRGFAKVARHVIPALGRAVHRLTGGRVPPGVPLCFDRAAEMAGFFEGAGVAV